MSSIVHLRRQDVSLDLRQHQRVDLVHRCGEVVRAGLRPTAPVVEAAVVDAPARDVAVLNMRATFAAAEREAAQTRTREAMRAKAEHVRA